MNVGIKNIRAMEKIKAIEILKDFNDYRRNVGVYDVDEPCEPKDTAIEIGEAIDKAICTLIDSDGKCEIIEAVVLESGIDLEKILSESRERDVVVAREVAASLLRKQGYTLKEIGGMINRSHSNVMHLVEEVEYWESDRDLFARELRLLKQVKKRVGVK